MTTQTLYTYTCDFCEAVAKAVGSMFKTMITFFERVSRARAAAELSRQGYYEEAKRIMLETK